MKLPRYKGSVLSAPCNYDLLRGVNASSSYFAIGIYMRYWLQLHTSFNGYHSKEDFKLKKVLLL